jgi:hypothetical protein
MTRRLGQVGCDGLVIIRFQLGLQTTLFSAPHFRLPPMNQKQEYMLLTYRV